MRIRIPATAAIAMLLASCHQTTPVDAPYFPFPPRRDRADTAPLGDNALRSAAYAATAAASEDFGTTAPVDDPVTGGVTIRAVRAVGDFSTGVAVDLCVYDTPGLYKLDSANPSRVTLTSRAGLIKVTVIKNPPPTPENQLNHLMWHFANVQKQDSFSPAESEQTCSHYRPEPFLQEPPKPLSAFPKP